MDFDEPRMILGLNVRGGKYSAWTLRDRRMDGSMNGMGRIGWVDWGWDGMEYGS